MGSPRTLWGVIQHNFSTGETEILHCDVNIEIISNWIQKYRGTNKNNKMNFYITALSHLA